MALHNGIDTIAYVCEGWYTNTYITATGGGSIASLMVSAGMLESAPEPPADSGLVTRFFHIAKKGLMFATGWFGLRGR